MDDFEKTGRAKKLAKLGRLKQQVTQIEAELGIEPANGDYVWVGRNAKDILGFSPHDLIGKSAYEFFHPDDLDRIARDHADSIERDPTGKPQIAAITRDIHDEMMAREAALKADQVAQKRLEKLAHTDQLTGLANRLVVADEE